LSRRQHRIDLRLVAWQSMKLSDRNFAHGTGWPDCFNGCIEHPQRHRHIARMRGDTRVADADDCMLPAVSADSTAAAARHALVAGLVRVIKIRAARSLQE